MITHIPTGRKYIGKKQLYFNRKHKLTKKERSEIKGTGRKPLSKKIILESNWNTYWGSSIPFNKLVREEGENKFKKEILCFCNSKRMLSYYETKYLFLNNALESEEFYNDNIMSKFFSADFKKGGFNLNI